MTTQTSEGEQRPRKGDGDLPTLLAPGHQWHLALDTHEESLTNFEFAVLQVTESFQRFAVQAVRVASDLDLTFNEVVALHVVRMQERPKDSATIAQLMNRDDLPNLQYSLRKLVKLGLLERTKARTASVFTVTDAGRAVSDRYAALRRQALTTNLSELTDVTARLQQVVRSMHVLTGLYDNAARELATIDPSVILTDDEESGRPTSR